MERKDSKCETKIDVSEQTLDKKVPFPSKVPTFLEYVRSELHSKLSSNLTSPDHD